jgi:transportin-1
MVSTHCNQARTHKRVLIFIIIIIIIIIIIQPLIRSITCWTLSRFSGWLVEQNDPEQYIRPILELLLERVVDSNKRVQQVACSAFATLEEVVVELAPYLDKIVSTLMYACRHYQAKNMLILYDALGTLAEVVGPALNKPEYADAILAPLMVSTLLKLETECWLDLFP